MMKQVDSKFEFTTFALWKKIFLYLYWIENEWMRFLLYSLCKKYACSIF